MIKKIDIENEEFQTSFELTRQFTDKVCKDYGFVYNPENDINESIQIGLTRNKLIYNRRYCPCFMVIGKTQEEKDNSENRLCPCKPALEKEIPVNGRCHCGIFCTPEYARTLEEKVEVKEEEHLKIITKNECKNILNKKQISAIEVEALLEARELGIIEFSLVDTREWMEWLGNRIQGTDFLVPTTSFYQTIEKLDEKKDIPVVVYCHSGSRSAYCQRIMLDMGFKSVSNLDYGIISYQGEIISGR
ncbi:MAG: sulfurtransferase [Arcobacter sp.]|nr:sulfurtransferase [Arcobacter sp.]